MLTPEALLCHYEALGIPKGAAIAVAVSGGADSLCLLLLTAASFNVTALTVDHGLRDGSAAEAKWVAEVCERSGIPHVTLLWQGEKPTANIQAQAREARYELMRNWCVHNGVHHLATAHHREDQAETVLLRLARGSGVYGLAGMAPTRDMGKGVLLVRPLLDVAKQNLLDSLTGMSQKWIEDPSNRSEAYDRIRIRNFLANPPVEGLTAKRIAATAARLRRSRDALEHYEQRWLETAAQSYEQGYVTLKLSALTSEPEEIILRGIATICRYVSGGTYVPRMEKLLRLRTILGQEGFKGHTLYGVKFSPMADNCVLASREIAAIEGPVSVEDHFIWDKRFAIEAKGDISGLKMKILGVEGWAYLKKNMADFGKIDIPRLVGIGLPAVYK
ncbi:MAG: tRNA lysidine(34) synthetase TilS, partial [Kordiimonadaceae bacterium]|nr:tRNA lysidine(34) synthetase TilS [Kordiimonadaceae bacterium]